MKMRIQELIEDAKSSQTNGRPKTKWSESELACLEKIAAAIRSGELSKNQVLKSMRAILNDGKEVEGLEGKSVNAIDMMLREII